MVVKCPKLVVHDDHLMELENHIQHINEDPNYLPSSNELIQISQDIINCLAKAEENKEQMWTILQSVEECILRILNTVNSNARHKIIYAILQKFYTVLSDPESEAGPATSIVLVVFAGSGEDAMLSAARWLVQQNENGPASAGLKAALSCLYSWMCEWRHTLTLADWVMSFIKALQENEKFDILVETSLDHIEQLFLAINNVEVSRENVIDVIFLVLAALRESPEAFAGISPHVDTVLTNLAAESGQGSRHLLQTLVDILTTMVDLTCGSIKSGVAKEIFRNKHRVAISCLEKHMASRTRSYMHVKPWRTRNSAVAAANPQSPITITKVGLLNLGNTCYMNSVMQALLYTRQFSTHVMLRMTEAPYWSRMGILFAKMMHSLNTRLNPDELFSVVKPPFFTKNNQHDSSEFLGYLLMLLQSYEHCSDTNFDYSRPPVITNAARLSNRHSFVVQETGSSASPMQSDANQNPGPRPGSSAGGSSSNTRKRPILDYELALPRKRAKVVESFIDNIFGGVLQTRIQCSVCCSSSQSWDTFRDLQLAFPDKLDGCQHSVQGLLDYYCSQERMSGDNKYDCRACGGLREAERSVVIETTPKYLILVLKNFKFESKTQQQTKLMLSTYHNHIVTVPTVLAPNDPSIYSLYAAVIHDGTTLDSGHYYTLAMDNEQWFLFNDDTVSAVDENQLNSLSKSCTPYILFYRRTDIEEGAAPTIEDLPPLLQESVMVHNKKFVETVRQICRARP